MMPVRRQSHRLGWSIAQRHVIALTIVQAAVHAKNYRTALTLLSELKVNACGDTLFKIAILCTGS